MEIWWNLVDFRKSPRWIRRKAMRFHQKTPHGSWVLYIPWIYGILEKYSRWTVGEM
jgi:hypothetical protein